MKLLIIVLTFCSINAFAQGEEAAIKQTINRFFEGMRTADSSMIKTTLAPTAIFQTLVQKKDGTTTVETESIAGFIAMVAKPHLQAYDERIAFDVIKTDAGLAMAWTPYRFYTGAVFSHCGVNSFQLVKLGGNWKIQYIIDTRRKEPCL